MVNVVIGVPGEIPHGRTAAERSQIRDQEMAKSAKLFGGRGKGGGGGY